jgi:hypothetical protein
MVLSITLDDQVFKATGFSVRNDYGVILDSEPGYQPFLLHAIWNLKLVRRQ